MTVEEQQVVDQFQNQLKEHKSLIDKATEEAKKSGSVTAETQEAQRQSALKLDEWGKKMEAQGKEQGERMAEVRNRLDEGDKRAEKLEADIRLVKQKGLARMPGGGPGGEDERTFGQRLVETPEFKAMQFNGRFKFTTTMSTRIESKANTIVQPGSGFVTLPQRVGVFPSVPFLPLYMRDLLTVVPLTMSNAVEYKIETWNYAADYQVLQGDKKAQGDVTYTEATATAKTIAWFVKISRQMLDDNAYIAATIDSRLIYGVLKKEDLEILLGSGAAGHLNGIMTQAPASAAPPASATTRLDELMVAITRLTALGFSPTAIVLNPTDWGLMQITKTTQGAYILGGPPQAEAVPRLWGLPLVADYNMPAGQYLVGAFPGNAALFDRQAATVEMSMENEDDFVRNLVTIRAEERVALAVFVPNAFLKGTFVATTLMAEAEPEEHGRAHGNKQK
jgi:HK97 family phage major capsid protein